MQFRVNPKDGDRLPALGMGCMRLPTRLGGVDEEKAIALIQQAQDLGVTYFDSAYIYHRGQSEGILGKALLGERRERAQIATKMPLFMVTSYKDLDKLFQTQLDRLQTSYIDYYLLHMLSDPAMFERLSKLGIASWMEAQKQSGRIRRIGFSFHGHAQDFQALLKVYPWDFCQIQYNYMDINNQAGTAGLKAAAAMGIPIIAMEPLRGGTLANGLPPAARDALGQPPVPAALRWLWDQAEVTVVLSGMGTSEQLIENVALAETALPGCLTASERTGIDRARTVLLASGKSVPCTACAYCMPCPQGVDIPGCFAYYNETLSMKPKNAWMHYMQNTGAAGAHPANAGRCTACGRCKAHCPQQIDIPLQLGAVAKALEGPMFRIATPIMRKVTSRKVKLHQ